MCEFISWIERRDRIYFLTGDQLFRSKKGDEFRRTISPDDYCGHGTIRDWYGIDSGDGIDKECSDFSSPANFPHQIVEAIKSNKLRGFPMPQGLLRKPLDYDYKAKWKLLDDDYWAKLKPIDDDYWAKRKPIDDDYKAKLKLLDDDYWAKRKPLDDDYWAKRKPIDDDYWALFMSPENRAEVWK